MLIEIGCSGLIVGDGPIVVAKDVPIGKRQPIQLVHHRGKQIGVIVHQVPHKEGERPGFGVL